MATATLAIKDGTGTSQTLPVRTDADGNKIPIHSLDSSSPHYSAGTNNFAAVATPTVFAVLTGSSTKAVRLKKIVVTGAATAAGSMIVQVDKCSDAGTLGSAVLSSALAAAPHDPSDAAATATLKTVGTANYGTPPASVGILGTGRLQMAAIGSAATSGAVVPFVIDYANRSDKAPVLRSAAQCITISGAGSAIPSGGKIDLFVEWEEAPSTE